MTPPEQQGAAPQTGAGVSAAPAVSSLLVLKKRADFLRAARARRQGTPGFMLQARQRGGTEPQPDAIRVGFTCSKKVGNAVARNRAKRRLRALAHDILPGQGRPGWDYVLIGRAGETASRDFSELCRDLARALQKVHG